MSRGNDVRVTGSSGNVFADLGLDHPEEAMAKAEIARAIGVLIAAKDLTQTQAAELLEVDQPKVSALVRGRLSGFSLDRLLGFLLALDRDVDIVIKPKADRSRGRVSVITSS